MLKEQVTNISDCVSRKLNTPQFLEQCHTQRTLLPTRTLPGEILKMGFLFPTERSPRTSPCYSHCASNPFKVLINHIHFDPLFFLIVNHSCLKEAHCYRLLGFLSFYVPFCHGFLTFVGAGLFLLEAVFCTFQDVYQHPWSLFIRIKKCLQAYYYKLRCQRSLGTSIKKARYLSYHLICNVFCQD
jgi:hypothetical protein